MIQHQNEISDQQIIEWIGQSRLRDKGFRLLVEKYQERLYWQIRKRVLTHENTHDVLQNCLIKIYKGLPNFEGDSQLFTWMYRIAVNESITFFRKHKKFQSDSIDDIKNHIENELKADQYFDENQTEIILHKAINSLPEKQKEVFRMRYFDDLSYAEMSEITGTSQGGLKASFHHAVKKIEAFIRGAF